MCISAINCTKVIKQTSTHAQTDKVRQSSETRFPFKQFPEYKSRPQQNTGYFFRYLLWDILHLQKGQRTRVPLWAWRFQAADDRRAYLNTLQPRHQMTGRPAWAPCSFPESVHPFQLSLPWVDLPTLSSSVDYIIAGIHHKIRGTGCIRGRIFIVHKSSRK